MMTRDASGAEEVVQDAFVRAFTNLDAFFGQLVRAGGARWEPVGDDVLLYDPDRDEVRCGGDRLGRDRARYGSFYCVADDVIALDMANLGSELYQIGDFALAGVGLASVAAILLNLILPQHSEEGAMESAKD